MKCPNCNKKQDEVDMNCNMCTFCGNREYYTPKGIKIKKASIKCHKVKELVLIVP